MKKTIQKCLAVLLAVMLLSGLNIGSAAGETGENIPRRLSVCAHTDAVTKGFCWYTDAPADSRVRVYNNGVDISGSLTFSGGECVEWEGAYMHKVTVTGLQRGQTYTYEVGNGSVWSESGTFVTDDGDDTFRFIAIADVQASSLESFQKGAATLNAAFKTAPNAEFVVNCGDFTNDSTNEEWDYYDETFAALNRSTTLVPVSGNHDGSGVWHWFDNMFNLDTSESVQTLNGVNYSFDYGNAHIAVLNTNDMAAVSDAQLRWLKNDLNSTDMDWKMLFIHKSPYSFGKNMKWPDGLYLREALTAVCDETGVDLVIAGHEHLYLRTKTLYNNQVSDTGTVYVLAGTAGTKRYEIRSFLAGTFMDTNIIGAMTVQKNGYANYWNGSDWNSTAQTNVGGCFNDVSVSGGTLTLNAYILADEKDALGNDVITKIDSVTITKQTGQNTPAFEGDNTTSAPEYGILAVPTFLRLLIYSLTDWLPKFLWMLPNIVKVYIEEGIF